MFWPCETRTSTCRSFATISSGLYRFLAIAVLLNVKDIPRVGPLQWGWITLLLVFPQNRPPSNASNWQTVQLEELRSTQRRKLAPPECMHSGLKSVHPVHRYLRLSPPTERPDACRRETSQCPRPRN